MKEKVIYNPEPLFGDARYAVKETIHTFGGGKRELWVFKPNGPDLEALNHARDQAARQSGSAQ